MRTWMMAMALVAAPAMAAEQQFDLVCTAKKVTVRYRVDLNQGEWCEGDCSSVRKIVGTTSGSLTLVDEQPVRSNGLTASTTINRTTGEWFDLFYMSGSPRPPIERRGLCSPLAFSGFPKAKF